MTQLKFCEPCYNLLFFLPGTAQTYLEGLAKSPFWILAVHEYGLQYFWKGTTKGFDNTVRIPISTYKIAVTFNLTDCQPTLGKIDQVIVGWFAPNFS